MLRFDCLSRILVGSKKGRQDRAGQVGQAGQGRAGQGRVGFLPSREDISHKLGRTFQNVCSSKENV